MKPFLYIACEGATDVPILRKITEELGFEVLNIWEQGGSGNLRKKLLNYNAAAHKNPNISWFVVLDLDERACAPIYVQECLPDPAKGMIFRIAIREIESWIMADREHFSKFFRVPIEKVPFTPDEEGNPKEKLIQIVKNYCRDKNIRSDMVPMGTAEFGRGHAFQIQNFLFGTKNTWRLPEAIKHSKSLHKATLRLSELIKV